MTIRHTQCFQEYVAFTMVFKFPLSGYESGYPALTPFWNIIFLLVPIFTKRWRCLSITPCTCFVCSSYINLEVVCKIYFFINSIDIFWCRMTGDRIRHITLFSSETFSYCNYLHYFHLLHRTAISGTSTS